jgi:hypothetical protein
VEQALTNYKDSLLRAKFYYAGGSARWMFNFTYEEWLFDFNIHFTNVQSYRVAFGEDVGELSPTVRHHMRGLTRMGKYFFISAYTLKLLSEKCDDKKKFILDSYRKAEETQNPAFCGWIFEFDVDYQLDLARTSKSSISVNVRGGGEEKWNVDYYQAYITTSDIIAAVNVLQEGTDLWLKPKLWCEPDFDFLRFRKVGAYFELEPVNATHAFSKRTVLLSVVHTLATFLCKNGVTIGAIRFVFLVPPQHAFSVTDVIGRLCEWDIPGYPNSKKWPNWPKAQKYIEEKCIAIVEFPKTRAE